MAVGARAADLPVKAPVRTTAAAFNWTGCYGGGNVGYGWARASATVSALGIDESGSETLTGVVAGGQLGCNYQVSNIVFGLEGDFQGTSERHTSSLSALGITVTTKDTLPWFATARGRLGVAANNWLFYGTGGWAYAEFKSVATVTGLVTGSFSTSNERSMWVAGGGVENMFMPNWSWKLEYLYMTTGSFTNATTVAGIPITTVAKFNDNVVRVGLNYHF